MNTRDLTNEIARAIEGRDMRALEEMFRALVGYPGEAGVIESAKPESLMSALERVSGALAHDTSIMPSGTCDQLDLLLGSTYADGVAEFVQRRHGSLLISCGSVREGADHGQRWVVHVKNETMQAIHVPGRMRREAHVSSMKTRRSATSPLSRIMSFMLFRMLSAR